MRAGWQEKTARHPAEFVLGPDGALGHKGREQGQTRSEKRKPHHRDHPFSRIARIAPGPRVP
jgi:hypothetical protein